MTHEISLPKALVVLLAISILGVLGTPAATAATYYVAKNGNDGNPGTEAAPYLTISKGVSVLNPGDTVYVKTGVYEESVTNIPGGTSWSSPVTVAVFPGHSVTIRPKAGEYRVLFFGGADTKYIEVDGFILDAVNCGYDGIKIASSGDKGYAHHIRIKNCEIMNAPNQGILTGGESHYNEFINLKVHDNGVTDFEHGIYLGTDNNLIENSSFYNNAGWGIHVYSGKRSPANNTVRNNKSYNNARAGDRGPGIGLYSGPGNVAYNNLVWGNDRGIVVGLGASGSKVYNNTVYDNIRDGILILGSSSNALVKNNITYKNGTNLSDTGSGTSMSNNLAGIDPRFANEAARDFHLLDGSPAHEMGAALNEVPMDYDGAARPQHNSYDAGAYELITDPTSRVSNLRRIDLE